MSLRHDPVAIPPNMGTNMSKQAIIEALDGWIKQRPGLEYGNYGDPVSYRAEMRGITRDLHHARTLLRHVELSGITGAQLDEAFKRAFAGRLLWDGKALDYCTGQYWPTEYRRAACAVLASALWTYWRDDCGYTGAALRVHAARVFGRGIASRWFN
jgi:hypothetical protein